MLSKEQGSMTTPWAWFPRPLLAARLGWWRAMVLPSPARRGGSNPVAEECTVLKGTSKSCSSTLSRDRNKERGRLLSCLLSFLPLGQAAFGIILMGWVPGGNLSDPHVQATNKSNRKLSLWSPSPPHTLWCLFKHYIQLSPRNFTFCHPGWPYHSTRTSNAATPIPQLHHCHHHHTLKRLSINTASNGK